MKRISPALAILTAITPGPAAWAQGCPPADGKTIALVEELNQRLLDEDFLGFAQQIEAAMGMNIRGGIESISKTYTGGFDACTTVLQRSDTGGMVQAVVMYRGAVGPLFGFFRTVEAEGATRLVSFSLNGSIDEVMAKLH
jgi:hypothetical protein